MNTPTQTPAPDDSTNADDQAPDKDDTLTTDVSETDDEGTTVREAEVDPNDLTEKSPDDEDKS